MSTVDELTTFRDFACEVAQAAGAAILPHFRAAIDVEDKGSPMGYDPVTVADRAAETVIRDAIRQRFPTHGLLGEEHGREAGSSRYTWVIDPIDGTKSFILGQIHWGTLLALHDGARPIVGVASQPYVGELFVATANGPAEWRRGSERRTLRTRRCASLGDAIAVTTDPRQFRSPGEQAAFDVVLSGARYTRYGGDLYCYTQLAMGLVDVVIETGLKPYDIQALMPIIEAAGGAVSAWDGSSCENGGSVIACGDRALHAQLVERLTTAAKGAR